MNVLQSFRTAIEMLRMNKLRAFLTMLGVIIGVMAVTIIVMVSSGFQYFMTNEFKKLGSDTIIVSFNRWGNNTEKVANIEGLVTNDVEMLRNQVESIAEIAPIIQAPSQKVVAADREVPDPRIYASDENFLVLNRTGIVKGRGITAEDNRARANVAIIGNEIEERLFPGEEALGKMIVFNGITLEVIGVFERIDIMGQSNGKDILVPLTTAQDKWLGTENLMMITTRPKPGIAVNQAMDDVWRALMLKSGNKRIYRVDSRESIGNVFGTIFGAAGIILSAIAALSLLVGGIGIMNIMLVSVTERTREIGLRKAVGAKRAAILTQFMIESATLSLIGGLIGMGIAFLIGKLVTLGTAAAKWPSAAGLPTQFPVSAAIGAAVFSAFIGVVFGLYPAISASKLDPIDALRRE